MGKGGIIFTWNVIILGVFSH